MAALSRAKKMPPLSRMLHVAQAKRRQTWQQQKMMAKALNAAFGGTVITRDRKG